MLISTNTTKNVQEGTFLVNRLCGKSQNGPRQSRKEIKNGK